MRLIPRLPVVIIATIAFLWIVVVARELGSREAREGIAAAFGLEKANKVHIKNISEGFGGQAVVEATIETVLRFRQNKEGKWEAVEVRLGDRDWESIELVRTAVLKEKTSRTEATLKTLAEALDAFRRDRGSYVVANSGAALIDNLAPRYLPSIMRLDAWSQEFDYQGTESSYRLASLGPDGTAGTADDIVIENGQLMRGSTE